eukprot:c47298_g1_i1.p1 GENE.c47298_g1_i1~~c47298_g1_i1.p1  ORF type:complete len:293 (+),score=49.36 c47298_g1_i1:50-928(+)
MREQEERQPLIDASELSGKRGSLATPPGTVVRTRSTGPRARAPVDGAERGPPEKLEYLFVGKLMLLPLFVASTLIAASLLLAHGKRPYNHGYFSSDEVFYGIAGLLLLGSCGFCAVALAFWIVIKITFLVDAERLTIVKRGIWRRSTLVFLRSELSLHYIRSHYVVKSAWLRLVVREGGRYYVVASWKGSGDQQARFFDLFARLQDAVAPTTAPIGDEIVSATEVTHIRPFASRLQTLAALRSSAQTPGALPLPDMLTCVSSASCAETLPLTDTDVFTKHFAVNKDAGMPPT